VNLLRLPIQRFLNIVYTWAVKRIDPEKREQWEFDLDAPLPWSANQEPSQEQLDREGMDFLNFMNQVNAGKN
jgi:hypothetical protein